MIKKIKSYLIDFYHALKMLILPSIFFITIGMVLGFYITNEDYSEDIVRINDQRHFFDYFFQNLSICIMMIVGMITFGLSSVYILFINGLMIGGAFKISLPYLMHPLQSLLLILPHGISELTAIMISGGIGFILLKEAILLLFGKKKKIDFKKYAKLLVQGLCS
ncbi:stage II sporulation protein M [Bacillus altitudinis]|uniref:Stage II sporulation protein M n=1 Tax=Bacillus altitudinis TaxID=293387 RepID=A0ABV1S9N3_BACAB